MPPLPRLKVPALAELARQLRFEPAKAARRQLELAEALVGQIDPAQVYPYEWVVFRLTGYRPDDGGGAAAASGGPITIPGSALLADLPPLIERLCVTAELRP